MKKIFTEIYYERSRYQMLKKMMALIQAVLILSLVYNLEAGELKTKPVLYTQSFEQEDPFEFWQSDGKYEVNFKGLTEEKAYSGKKSFKLDVTLKKGCSYLYWKIQIPVNVPSDAKLKLSGYILVENREVGDNLTTGLMANIKTFPIPDSACPALEKFKDTKGEWKLTEREGNFGKIANILIPRWWWGATGDNVVTYMEYIGLFVKGKGQNEERKVVYIDDIKLEGEVPIEEEHRKEAERKYAPYREKVNKKVAYWKEVLEERERELNSSIGFSEETERLEKMKEELVSIKKKVKVAETKGCIRFKHKREIDAFLKKGESIFSKSLKGKVEGRDILLYITPPISNAKIFPHSSFIPGVNSDTISISVCKGEYEPGSFVIHALKDIERLKVVPSDLMSEKGKVINASSVDIRVVKCWYLSSEEGYKNEYKKILTPELLLKDDSLVKVDYEKKENYLKLRYPQGQKYVWISNPKTITTQGFPSPVISIHEFPVKDSDVLLPVDIPEGENKQFWVTVKCPQDAYPELYTGKISLLTQEENLGTITLKLRVLPFELSSPKTNYDLSKNFICSLYYTGRLSSKCKEGTISFRDKSEKQLESDFKNMLSHGITNPVVYQPFRDKELLKRYFEIRQKAGIKNKTFYTCAEGAQDPPDKVREVIEFVKEYGMTEAYFYGADEVGGKRLKAQRAGWETLREAGGKVFVASMDGRESFEMMGDIQDLCNCYNNIDPEVAAKWHSLGHRITIYGYPHGGIVKPELYRRRYGLMTWRGNYDGVMDYAYQSTRGNPWNDYDCAGYHSRTDSYTRIAMDGPIDTTYWEGLREGIDDVRYATTLKLWIEKAKKGEDRKKKRIALEAEQYLKNLDIDRNLDTIRSEIIEYILKIHNCP